MTWHAHPDMIARYAEHRISPVQASSLEAHLLTCERCRRSVAERADRPRLDAVWSEITATADVPVPGPVERLLRRLGTPEHVGRLVAATPALRASWFTSVVLTLAFAAVASQNGRGDGGVFLFLVLAPLLPLAGVAVSFGPGVDPIHELAVAAPLRNLDLLLVRAAAVLATTAPVAGVASLALPGTDWRMAAWLLPALGLTAGSVALATWVTPWKASAGLAVAWVGAAVASTGRLAFGAGPRGPLAERFVAFRPSGQVVLAAFSVAAAIVVALRRDALEVGRSA